MYEKELKELVRISQAAGNDPAMVQGGGGNTSVKLDDELMAVKASGFQLKQITETDGYVVVKYRNLKEYIKNVDFSSGVDYEKDSTAFVKENIVRFEGMKELRPSVEAGFHSVLKKYVIHTHPVYANLLCCSQNGKELADRIFAGKDFTYAWIPSVNPGFTLSVKVYEAVEECIRTKGAFPEVILMENHGLIVSADDMERCISLHSRVNEDVKAFVGVKQDFPRVELEKVDEGTYVSRTDYLIQLFRDRNIGYDYFDRPLYPDQLVYLNGSICLDGLDNKLNIDTKTGQITYKAGYNEAIAIEETLAGVVYIYETVEQCGLKLKAMGDEEISFIKGWESEKYRRKLVQESNK